MIYGDLPKEEQICKSQKIGEKKIFKFMSHTSLCFVTSFIHLELVKFCVPLLRSLQHPLCSFLYCANENCVKLVYKLKMKKKLWHVLVKNCMVRGPFLWDLRDLVTFKIFSRHTFEFISNNLQESSFSINICFTKIYYQDLPGWV